jgi:hypothetical protein
MPGVIRTLPYEGALMSKVTVRKMGLKEALARRLFVVFVSRETDMAALRGGSAASWTVPSSARPGDLAIVYKPGEAAGWNGRREAPFEAFVAAGVVHGRPKRKGERFYSAPIGEVKVFPTPVLRSVITGTFPEWKWLRHMRGKLGVEVPLEIASDFLAVIGRLAYDRSAKTNASARKGRTREAG